MGQTLVGDLEKPSLVFLPGSLSTSPSHQPLVRALTSVVHRETKGVIYLCFEVFIWCETTDFGIRVL